MVADGGRVDGAAEHGRRLGVAQLLPENELEHFAVLAPELSEQVGHPRLEDPVALPELEPSAELVLQPALEPAPAGTGAPLGGHHPSGRGVEPPAVSRGLGDVAELAPGHREDLRDEVGDVAAPRDPAGHEGVDRLEMGLVEEVEPEPGRVLEVAIRSRTRH